ncbi:hypothetical protein [Staphylococcus devriesei]|uniref:Uncharacterized protein n=1 Tax=Staphylococcus devriesei TaxID=586733 RepID=A0A2T4KFA5_9STAP|nr:hypothetical protein [Staphylococcus devriesei]PTE70856.1 hypothetical protein BUY44_10520 [Staphylococcus devriesei]
MKKIFASLGVILLVAILGVAMLFAYGSYKDLELKRAEAKLDEKKDKHEKNNKEKESSKKHNNDDNGSSNEQPKEDNSVATEQQNTSAVNNQQQTASTSTNDNTNSLEQNNVSVGSGSNTQQNGSSKEDNSQVANNTGGATQPKYTAEDTKHMTDDEFLNAYKEGMSSDEAAAVDSNTADSKEYINFLRGQVEAREHGQGGTY